MDLLNTFARPETGDFIFKVIAWLINSTSSVAVGIILFTLILKLITLPFDFFSRVSMRKNSLKMEEMRPELEKLQKQYAGDKALYNQKMMALYKKNGYSMFGSCLPTILTLVIFIVAINGFTSYSQFQNRQYFYDMTCAYNEVVFSGFDYDGTYIYRNENNELAINTDKVEEEYKKQGELKNFEIELDGKDYKIVIENFNLSIDEENVKSINYDFYTTNGYLKASKEIVEKGKGYIPLLEKFQKVDENGKAEIELKNEKGQTFVEAYNLEELDEEQKFASLQAFLLDVQQTEAKKEFERSNSGFLWVKNIWVTDSPLKHPVESDWDSFVNLYAYPKGDSAFLKEDYEKLTGKLQDYKQTQNGYFILVALTAGVSFLTQIVTKKTQKAQMELQTVDGQGAQTQKVMTVVMPIMMAVFAFMCTAAFSIYIVLSSVFGLITTFAINFIVDRKYKKKTTTDEVVRGRVYVPKEEPKKEPPKKQKVDKNKPMENDFLAGNSSSKKHIRGRIK